jgi:hypothetical protein
MPNLTFTVSDELYAMIREHPEIKWSAIARQALREYYSKLKRMDKLLKNSKLTSEDVEQIADSIKKGMWKRHKKSATGEQ